MTQPPEEPGRAEAAHRSLEQLFELAAMMADYMADGLADRRLTRARAEVVWRLHGTGPITQRRLSELLGVTPRNVTGLLDALASQGLIERQPHPTDRRAALVSLTEAGTATAKALAIAHREFAELLFADVSSTEVAAFSRTLDHVLETLRKSGPAEGCAEEAT